METAAKEKFLTLPNILSLTRVALIPVFIAMMLKKDTTGSLAVFFLAGITDLLDGLAARTLHLKTRIGIFLDPFADKLLLTTAYVMLTIRDLGAPYFVPLWLTILVISRDLVIVTGAYVIFRMRGRRSFPPTLLGKISTVCQISLIFWVLFSNYWLTSSSFSAPFLAWMTSTDFLSALNYLTFGATFVSGLHYGLIGYRMAYPMIRD